ncbi:polynucleotide 3'-phosphatase /polynucleotide 5'-hydroxyl-kinase /polynucleotide 2',3'-cyclic phosphate phosphodiesterase [Planomicrobium soli]|uniref:Polynucleotide 3'-phosphatase /polynucleotide 5'-hydroxyl-kinase /polynucleotide 2',3'-cyclic phosphate phosphodiesterase n=1 Tax=Planomicrobium soli TaxID=1176648 RepID=A0A2P8H412_9BACL|nr:polynucleotide kinase-phosphatase [Planomicrobium soli]PSL40943.1 polynucleotide 3'-phosphatase /polynucleotide 5'-hydroxyl-kinase /polynucleotide 2',3'-cyclic phosphate phosphodiesterase [Planomicrobium soli]
MNIGLPHAGIVLLVGPSNSGKSTLMNKLINEGTILPSEVIGSDQFRILVSDKEFIDWSNRPQDEAAGLIDEYAAISEEAFSMMDALIEARCRLNKVSIVDATHLHSDARKRYVALAEKNHVPIISLVFDIPEAELLRRDEQRDFPRGKRRIKQQAQVFNREKRWIKKEGFASVYSIKDTATLEFFRRENPLEKEIGPGIDLIGDIHGCFEELLELLHKLDYRKNEDGLFVHPQGRKFVSVGDIMSRGPASLETMRFFQRHINQELAYMVDSNHGWKIARWLDGRNVVLSHGDEKVEAEFLSFENEAGSEPALQLKGELKEILLQAPSHLVFTANGVPVLVCAHAGIKDEFIGKQSAAVRDFCRYGDTGGFDLQGKPVRKDWTASHTSRTLIVWGHDPKPRPLLVNNTINIDQGAVFGGQLTAYRFPERDFVAVAAKENYAGTAENPLQEWKKNRLNPPNIAKFLNGYSVLTEELGEVKVQQENVKPAIDNVSHFTVPIEQLLYIPPTMSPTPKPSSLDGYLEHPKEAIDYYRSNGIDTLIAEKKHMGSRAVLLLFENPEAALKHTGIDTIGIIHTRTGKRFFDTEVEQQVVRQLISELQEKDYFRKHDTEFVLLDAEIMPWNLKAKQLISAQYAHVAENAILDRSAIKNKLAQAANEDIQPWLSEYEQKLENAQTFRDVFQKYCWEVDSLESIQIAPFHVLAHSKETFFDKPHTWHMEMNREFAEQSELFVATEFKLITDEASEDEMIAWWNEMTEDGHEGIVIKPNSYLARKAGKLLQPAIKVRGRKYLSIIYGMDYLEPENLARLKSRNTGKKQKMALKEFALGLEGITRFLNGESIERVHECVLATLALESDPVDPRL